MCNSLYVFDSKDGYYVAGLKTAHADAIVIGEMLEQTARDCKVALLNPLLKDTFWWPLNMFNGLTGIFLKQSERKNSYQGRKITCWLEKTMEKLC